MVNLTSIKAKAPTNKEEAQGFLNSLDLTKSGRENARLLSLPYTTFRNWKIKAENLVAGYDVPLGHGVKGISRLIDEEGNIKLEWVKTDRVKDEQDAMMEVLDSLKDDIPRADPVDGPGHVHEDLLSCYVLSDYHFGMLAWGEETGDDWDTEIASDTLIRWFKTAIRGAPNSHTAVLAQLGDFLHWDGLEAVTPSSGHVLDADSRFPKVVDMAVKALRHIVRELLEQHQHVHIIMAEGNHDIASSIWLRIMFEQFYENEPRVTVDTNPLPYYAYQWGDTSLFFHHGHKKRLNGISKVMAGYYRDMYGSTKFSYAHTGHLHHAKVEEDELMTVRQHPTLAAKDAYAARGGYLSQRAASVITYSKKYGLVGEAQITPEMI